MSSSFADSVAAIRFAAFLLPATTKLEGREQSAAILDRLIKLTNESSVRTRSMYDPYDDEGHSRLALLSPQIHPVVLREGSMIPSADYRGGLDFHRGQGFQKNRL